MKIGVLGAGSWGTALAMVLADKDHEVKIWSIIPDQLKEINEKRTNNSYLKNITIPERITAVSTLEETIEGADYIIMSVPSSAVREVSRNLKPLIKDNVILVNTAKGIEPVSLKRLSEVIIEEIPGIEGRLVVLSGPSHAEEVAVKMPTAVVAASANDEAAEKVQDLFMNEYFRIYINSDVIGVEIGAALKNVIALATGISDGLGFGDNTKAAIITRGMAEIVRMGMAMGAQPLTFAGLSGIGDLVVTATSMHSRNRRAGIAIGKGEKIEDIKQKMGMVIEGVRTAEAIIELNKKYNVDTPITNHVYKIIYENEDPLETVYELMKRDKKREIE
jgi:glycerol-3-phosphate dehydrogenase (NAD(P)+)